MTNDDEKRAKLIKKLAQFVTNFAVGLTADPVPLELLEAAALELTGDIEALEAWLEENPGDDELDQLQEDLERYRRQVQHHLANYETHVRLAGDGTQDA